MFSKILLSCVIICLNILYCAHAFTWSDCGLRNATIHFSKLDIRPKPTRFARPVWLTGQMKVDEDVVQGARSQLTLWRVVNLFWTWPIEVRIGCFGDFGSCSKDLCERMRNSDSMCALASAANTTCDCPLRARVEPYVVNDRELEVPGSAALTLLAGGLYKFRWIIRDKRGNELGCLQGQLRIE